VSPAERLERLSKALPPGVAVVLFREHLVELARGENALPGAEPALTDGQDLQVDLTVSQVAQAFGRTPNTVRRWLNSGDLEGYRFHGRQWRITRSAIETFQERQRKGQQTVRARNGTRPLDAWRMVEP